MAKATRIVIVERQRILRDGLKSLLSHYPGLEVTGEAENGLEAVHIIKKIKPGIIILDLVLQKMDGLDVVAEIRKMALDTRILVLTELNSEAHVFEALRAGVDGYLLKDAGQSELKLAMEHIAAGRMYLSPGISQSLVKAFLEGKKPGVSTPLREQLTKRERQILKLVAEGNRNKEIATCLCISVKTVSKHRANLMRKVDCHNASQLTAFAIENGLIPK